MFSGAPTLEDNVRNRRNHLKEDVAEYIENDHYLLESVITGHER